MFVIAKKNMLGRRLNMMQRLMPTQYNFFPKTYMMPHDFKDFTEYVSKQKHKNQRTFIVKPADECQGRGIFLTRDASVIKPDESMVVQSYVHKPHLIDGLKYDLRVYAAVVGMNPPRIYVYKDGLARFATIPYEKPHEKNIDNLCMHLTNVAINKHNILYE